MSTRSRNVPGRSWHLTEILRPARRPGAFQVTNTALPGRLVTSSRVRRRAYLRLGYDEQREHAREHPDRDPGRRRRGGDEDDHASGGGGRLMEAQLAHQSQAKGEVTAEVERHAPAEGEPRAVAEGFGGMAD